MFKLAFGKKYLYVRCLQLNLKWDADYSRVKIGTALLSHKAQILQTNTMRSHDPGSVQNLVRGTRWVSFFEVDYRLRVCVSPLRLSMKSGCTRLTLH